MASRGVVLWCGLVCCGAVHWWLSVCVWGGGGGGVDNP
jgi:hypothetical protein